MNTALPSHVGDTGKLESPYWRPGVDQCFCLIRIYMVTQRNKDLLK